MSEPEIKNITLVPERKIESRLVYIMIILLSITTCHSLDLVFYFLLNFHSNI